MASPTSHFFQGSLETRTTLTPSRPDDNDWRREKPGKRLNSWCLSCCASVRAMTTLGLPSPKSSVESSDKFLASLCTNSERLLAAMSWDDALLSLAVEDQVWSLTQFYSVDFSKSRIDVKNAFSTNAQSRCASVVVDCVLGPPLLARHT